MESDPIMSEPALPSTSAFILDLVSPATWDQPTGFTKLVLLCEGGKSTSSPPNTAISPSKSQRMDYSSEADDEDGWGESETDWYADRAMTSPNLVKRRSSHSPSGWGCSLS